MSEAWVEVRVVVPVERAEHLGTVLVAHGAAGWEEAPPPGVEPRYRQPWDTEAPPTFDTCTVKAWLPPELADAACLALEAAAGASVERELLEGTDWDAAWRSFHRRHPVSARLAVAPPWEARPGDLVIPPGQAFGTGDHPTTARCLEGIDALAVAGQRCLDVGCGSGVLALAAAKLGMVAHGTDIDPLAVRTARENAVLNGLEATFDGRSPGAVGGTWHLVVANLYAEVLAALLPEIAPRVGRDLLLAGILTDRVHLVVGALPPWLVLRDRVDDGDWAFLHLTRA